MSGNGRGAITVTNVRLRTYNVGFGDAFLMSISYSDATKRHILIDFGSTALAVALNSMETIARAIADHCEHKLHMVVATHRHADHIGGFRGRAGKIIAGLRPDLVVQPWTEDPRLDPNATTNVRRSTRSAALGLTTSLAAMQSVAETVAKEGRKLAASKGLPATLAGKIQFLGETNLSNASAVNNLRSMGPNVYARFGTKLRIRRLLPGVTIDVLGPPTLEQAPGIARMASRDAQEYWHLAAQRAPRQPTGAAAPLFPNRRRVPVPQEAKWIVPQVERAHADEVLGIVRALDDVLNNTSLILLFEVAGTTLLFPGDAQIENWSHALFAADNSAEIRRRLAKTMVYKVGHHGSLNATPKTLWQSFDNKSLDPAKPGRLTTMLSTKAGKHGDHERRTEVPRRKLVDELRANSELVTTERMRSASVFWRDVEICAPVGSSPSSVVVVPARRSASSGKSGSARKPAAPRIAPTGRG